MAIILGVVLAIGINASQELLGCGCEDNNICRDVENNTALPNEAGCEHFFICIDGTPIPNTCPQGTLKHYITISLIRKYSKFIYLTRAMVQSG